MSPLRILLAGLKGFSELGFTVKLVVAASALALICSVFLAAISMVLVTSGRIYDGMLLALLGGPLTVFPPAFALTHYGNRIVEKAKATGH